MVSSSKNLKRASVSLPQLSSGGSLKLLRLQAIHEEKDKVAALLNLMVAEGITLDNAVFGAITQMRDTQAVSTFDIDILVELPGTNAIDLLSPLYRFCESQGYQPKGETIRVVSWPVQLIRNNSPCPS